MRRVNCALLVVQLVCGLLRISLSFHVIRSSKVDPRLANCARTALSSNTDFCSIAPISRISGSVQLPGSKSLTNRVLLLAALCEGQTVVSNLLESEDTQYMISALQQLQVQMHVDAARRSATVIGCKGPPRCTGRELLYLGNAGTVMRPLAAVLSTSDCGNFILDGSARMRERPISDLVNALRQLNVDISCSSTGCPPVHITPHGVQSGNVRISGSVSSQFLSALLLAAPLFHGTAPTIIEAIDDLPSAPYVDMTVKLMRHFGARVGVDGRKFVIPTAQTYRSPGVMHVEGDASSGSYFLAGAAITGGEVTVYGCGSKSLQGDTRFAAVLRRMGCDVHYGEHHITIGPRDRNTPLHAIDEDCGDIPDVAMTLAMVAIFAQGRTVIRNIASWRVKETDRLTAMATELRKLGVRVETGTDYIAVHGLQPGERLRSGVEIDTYDDHRMAMCFSLAACGGVPVTIRNPGCTAKTFPGYFTQLEQVSHR